MSLMIFTLRKRRKNNNAGHGHLGERNVEVNVQSKDYPRDKDDEHGVRRVLEVRLVERRRRGRTRTQRD